LEENGVYAGKAIEYRTLQVEIMGGNIDHYQEMTPEWKIKLVQRNISNVLKDRPRREVVNIITGIISVNEEDIGNIPLDWTAFDRGLQPIRTMEPTNISTPSTRKESKSDPTQEDGANQPRV
jgi:hypothetical protein